MAENKSTICFYVVPFETTLGAALITGQSRRFVTAKEACAAAVELRRDFKSNWKVICLQEVFTTVTIHEANVVDDIKADNHLGNRPRAALNVGDLFTPDEMRRAVALYGVCKPGTFARRCEEEIVAPIMGRINETTGQQNNARYMAYMLEFAILKAKKEA